MRLSQLTAVAGLVAALALAGAARAETKVELKSVHLCCPGCTRAVGDILKKLDDVKGTCDQKAGTVTITAKDDEAAKKALQALADGGFHGDTGNKDLAIKDDSGVTKGKVEKLTLTGVHNCCNRCTTQLKEALKKVEGVKADTAKAKADTFEVTGDFDAEELVKALNAAGYHVKVKK
jgi:copper chaperone CopZ